MAEPPYTVWHAGQRPAIDMVVRQVYAFVDNGERLFLVQDDNGLANLPGGTPEPDDEGEVATLRRECLEESQVEITSEYYLGFVEVNEPGVDPYAQLRYYARADEWHPIAPDQSTGRTYGRHLVGLDQIADRLDWGPLGAQQVATLAEYLASSVDEAPAGGTTTLHP